MNQVEVTDRITDALKKLYRNDVYLIETRQHERAICAKLACYLQENFPDWNVDVDYNRDGKDPKKNSRW